jgi:rubrerythrin
MESVAIESFSLDEVFEIAGQMERNGAAFYTAAAEQIDGDDLKKMFNDLAGQELEHEKIFAALRDKLVVPDKAVAAYDVDEIVAAYLRAVAGRFVFPDATVPPDVLNGDESAVDVAQLAREREKDAIIFYLGIMDSMHENHDKAAINSIIREEQKHLIELTNLLLKLK